MAVQFCIIVGVSAIERAAVLEAVRTALPGAEVAELPTLEEALQRDASGSEMLILGQAAVEDLPVAIAAKDSTGVPRWPIVVLGEVDSCENAEAVSVCDSHQITRAIHSVLARYRLVEENARLRGDLLAVAYRVTHDLRTPLGGIISACEVVKECLVDHAPKEAEVATPLFESADEMGTLIERVSFVLKASAKPQAKQHAKLSDIVWAALQRLEYEAVERNALLIQPDNWPEIYCVPSWTEAIVGNLVSNALRHGGSPPRVELSWQEIGGEQRFCVRDNGKGVPEEIRTTLFQPFHSLHQLNGSRGLGLSFTRRLVDLQGGQCGYEAVPTGGSRFFFTLPKSAEASTKSNGRKAKVC